MKKLITILILCGWSVFGQTPKTVTMDGATNNASAFGASYTLGTDNNCTYYIAWDGTYIYVGWTGGNTNYSSDMYYVAFDTDPHGSNGSLSGIQGATFSSGNQQKFDYYLYYENNSSFGGVPTTNGNAYERWSVNSGNWVFVSRTGGDDGTNSQVVFSGTGGEIRIRIPWSDLGFTPGASAPLGISFWTNNASGNYIWSTFPISNPTGSTNQLLDKYIYYPSTGSGVTPSTAWSEQSLPVELTSFNAAIRHGMVDLKWETATEINNYGFEVERKSALTDWNKIGFVEGYGSTNSPKFYSFSDKPTGTGKISYRLKQIDNDGKYEYSPIVEVLVDNLPNGFVLEQNYPNPFNPETSIRFALKEDTKATLKVYNSLGAEVATLFDGTAEAGRYYDVKFGSGELASGFYIYKLVAGDYVSVKKMLLMK